MNGEDHQISHGDIDAESLTIQFDGSDAPFKYVAVAFGSESTWMGEFEVSEDAQLVCDTTCAPTPAPTPPRCPAGQTRVSGTCTACAPGQHCSGADLVPPSQLACPPGSSDHDSDPRSQCIECGDNTFAAGAGTVGDCAAATVCVPGRRVVSAETNSTDRECADCEDGTYAVGSNTDLCLIQPDECGPGSIEVQAASFSSPRLCDECELGVTVEVGDSNTCRPVTECAVGVVTEATRSTDRVCSNCAAGEEYFQPGLRSCRPLTICSAGQQVGTAATPVSDRQCSACPRGTFGASPGGTCDPCAVCGEGSPQITACTRLRDTVCTATQTVTFPLQTGARRLSASSATGQARTIGEIAGSRNVVNRVNSVDTNLNQVTVVLRGTALSGSISTILTVLRWIYAGIYMCGAGPSPVCA